MGRSKKVVAVQPEPVLTQEEAMKNLLANIGKV